MAFCLTKELADTLKQLAVKGEINIQEMYNMTSEARRSMFEKWVDPATARGINVGFEKAMVSEQQTALRNWVKETFTGAENASRIKKGMLDKIESLNDLGVLTPSSQDAFLSDLVATRLGITVTAEEASTLASKADNVQKLSAQESEFGTPTEEYFKAKKDIEDYLLSLNPAGKTRIATSISGRGAMLFSVKSPLLNIESNTIQALLETAQRRLSGIEVTKDGKRSRVIGNMFGRNAGYAGRYMKFAYNVFKQTGYDITRMRTLQGTEKVRGEQVETHAQGKGLTRRVGRFYEDVVFKRLMSAPDVAFSALHFADSANLASTKVAKQEGLKGNAVKSRALEIFKDATRINPKTKEGLKVREQAIADAEYSTYTNKSKLSDIALGIRNVLNLATGDFRAGDLAMPFVKTPANVIQVGLDYSGVLLPIDTIVRTKNMIKEIKNGETVTEASKRAFDGVARTWIRAGLGMALAHLVGSLFDPEDFIGEYPVSQKERELLKARNATTNSLKIGNKWVSLDYFGALGAPLVGYLYAKKYGATMPNKVFNYYVGVLKQASKLPGLELTADIWEKVDKMKFNTLGDNMKEVAKSALDFVSSRTIPGFLYDIAKATDKYERETNKDKIVTSIQNKIPGLRQMLPRKTTVFGQEIETESPLSTVLFGSRVKTEMENDIVNEMIRLYETGNLPSITDSTTTSGRMKELKQQIGEPTYGGAVKYFREEYTKGLEKTMTKGSYKKLSDEEKAKELTSIKDDALEKTLKKFKYKAKKKIGGLKI
jgi:hypothetical protein